MKKITLLFSLSIIIFGCANQQPETTTEKQNEALFLVKQLQEDFNVFRTTLEETHPGLYSFVSQDSMNYYFDQAYAKIDHPITKDEFFRLLSPLIRMTYDEHTSLDFSYKYDSLQKFMPIKIRWVNNIPYVWKNLLNNPDIIEGSEITSINGKNPLDIFKEMKSVYRNGTTDETLEYDVYSLHFDYLYASFFEQPDSFHLTAINPSTKKEYTINSPAILKTDTLHFIPVYKMAEEYCKKDTCYRFSLDKQNDYAKMTISGLSDYEMQSANIDFNKQLSEDFKIINANKINNLIVDLRYCFGGDPRYGASLLSYLSNKPFQIFDSLSSRLIKIPTYSKCISDIAETESKTWPNMLEISKNISKKNQIGNYYTGFRDSIFQPKKNGFKGNVYLILNSDIHSAGAVTAALFDYYSNAIIVGSPTAGPYNSGNAIETIYLTLPNTKIGVDIPLFHYNYAVPTNLYPYKKGINSDVHVKSTIDDIINNKDAALEKTIEIIKTKNKR